MSRYRNTMSELLKQVYENTAMGYIVKFANRKGEKIAQAWYKDEKSAKEALEAIKKNGGNGIITKGKMNEEGDHEISMARGELEAIADKATQLASMLKDKSDDGNPLEAWVQSKITKAKDYINSVSDYLMYNPDMKQNEEIEEGRKTFRSQSNIGQSKYVVNFHDGKKKHNDGSDFFDMKIFNNKIDRDKFIQSLKQQGYIEEATELEEGFSSSLKQKAKELAKKFANNMTKAVDEIEKLAKGLSKDKEVYNTLRQYNEEIELDEVSMKDIHLMDKEGSSAEEIAKKLKLDVKTVKSILGEEIHSHARQMAKDGVSAEKIKKMHPEITDDELKSLTQKDEEKESDNKEKEVASKDKEIQNLKNQNALLKQKIENEKHKAIKPEPNPQTGEVPLTIGIAHAEFKKQKEKEKEKEKEQVKEETLDEFTSSMIKDLQKSYADLKGKTLSPEKATALSKHLDRIDLVSLKQLVKADIPFISTLARNKIYKKTGKFEELKEQDGVEIARIRAERDKEDNSEVASKEKEIKSLKDQINVLKTKLENEKNKAIKPMPNPETGEVPLTIGIANKLLKDKEEKEAKEKKQKETREKLDQMAREETRLESFTRKFLSNLNESAASEKAKAMGLSHMSFGRYGKGGKVTHKSVGGTLQALNKKDQEKEKDTSSKDTSSGIKGYSSNDKTARDNIKFPDPDKKGYNGDKVYKDMIGAYDKIIKKDDKEGQKLLQKIKDKWEKTGSLGGGDKNDKKVFGGDSTITSLNRHIDTAGDSEKDKTAKPKTKTTGNIKNPDGSNTTSGSVKKEILQKIKDEDLTDPDMLWQSEEELLNLAQDLKSTGDNETASTIYDALDSVAGGEINPDANSKIKDMMDALQGKPNVSKAQNKKLFDMTKLYGKVKYNKNNIDDFSKDTINLIDQMAKTIEVSEQDPVDMGPQLRSDAIENITFTATDIMDKIEELDIDETIKNDLMNELEYISDENGDHDNYTKVGKIVSSIEEIKFNLKKLEKKSKIKKESFSEERRLFVESIAAIKNKAEKTGMPYNILKQVYDRGMAAWKGGHRPGAGQVQWALARVNSFVTKSSGTWGGADKDLAAKVKGEK